MLASFIGIYAAGAALTAAVMWRRKSDWPTAALVVGPVLWPVSWLLALVAMLIASGDQ